MSTIVFVSAPAHGHVNPTLPVVKELVARGETVVYYNTEEFRPQIERAGATFRSYPESDLTSTAISSALQAGNLANITVMILSATQTLLGFMLDDLPNVQPDVVIFDSIALWGRVAATLLNLRPAASIPHFVFDMSNMNLNPREFLRLMWQNLPKVPELLSLRSRINKKYGSHAFKYKPPLFPMRGGLNIVFTARELNPDTKLIDETFRFVGPSIDPNTRSEQFPFETLGDSALVYISLGTVHTSQAGFFKTCFEAFWTYPAQFIVAAGRQLDVASLGTVPPNFTVRPVVPQLEVLERASVFITHAGMNSLQESLYYGVPMVCVPQQFEQLMGARQIERKGAGVLLTDYFMRGRVEAETLREALADVIKEPKYREAARALQGILRAAGGYKQAADEIQAYVARQT